MKSGRIEQSSHNETYMGFFFAKAGSNWVAWVQSNLLKDEFLEYAKYKMQNAYSLLSHIGMQNANHGPKSTSGNK